jgi:hypothetical protein
VHGAGRCDLTPKAPLTWADGPGQRLVELEGIEPSSVERVPFVLRPFPWLRRCGCRPAGSGEHAEVLAAGSFPDVSGLSRRQRSLPAVHHRFCCRAAVVRPRAPSQVTMTPCRYLIRSSGEGVRLLVGSCVVAPFSESEQLGSRGFGFRSRRRNRSAPCQGTPPPQREPPHATGGLPHPHQGDLRPCHRSGVARTVEVSREAT